MKPILQERLMSEAIEKLEGLVQWETPEHETEVKEWLKTLILHTIEQTIKEVLALAPGFQSSITHEVTYDAGVTEYMARIKAVTDTQHALRGIIG